MTTDTSDNSPSWLAQPATSGIDPGLIERVIVEAATDMAMGTDKGAEQLIVEKLEHANELAVDGVDPAQEPGLLGVPELFGIPVQGVSQTHLTRILQELGTEGHLGVEQDSEQATRAKLEDLHDHFARGEEPGSGLLGEPELDGVPLRGTTPEQIRAALTTMGRDQLLGEDVRLGEDAATSLSHYLREEISGTSEQMGRPEVDAPPPSTALPGQRQAQWLADRAEGTPAASAAQSPARADPAAGPKPTPASHTPLGNRDEAASTPTAEHEARVGARFAGGDAPEVEGEASGEVVTTEYVRGSDGRWQDFETGEPVDDDVQAALDADWPAEDPAGGNEPEYTPAGEERHIPPELAAALAEHREIMEEANAGAHINPVREQEVVIGPDPDIDDYQLKQPDGQGSLQPPELTWRPPGYGRGDGAIDYGPDADIEYHGIETDVPTWVGPEEDLSHLAESITGSAAPSAPQPANLATGAQVAGLVDPAELGWATDPLTDLDLGSLREVPPPEQSAPETGADEEPSGVDPPDDPFDGE